MGNYLSNQHPSGILWNGMFDDFCELSPLWMGELRGPGQPMRLTQIDQPKFQGIIVTTKNRHPRSLT